MSATRRVSTPLTDMPCQARGRGASETRPRWGFSPTSPHHAAGMRIEPAPSEPSAAPTSPAATAAPLPPLEPPVVRCRSQGLRVTPKVAVSVNGHSVISGTFVLPMITAPASRSRRTTSASAAAGASRALVPHAVSSPATSMSSLTAIGTPSSGPRAAGRAAAVGLVGFEQRPFGEDDPEGVQGRLVAARSGPGRARPARARRPRRRRSARPAGRCPRMPARRAAWPEIYSNGARSAERGLRCSEGTGLVTPTGSSREGGAMSYPVTFEADYVERRNRLTTFFRLILAIPLAIVLYIYGIIAVRDRHRLVRDRDHRPLPEGPLRLRRGLHPLPHALHGLCRAALRPLPPVQRLGRRPLPGADVLRRAARAIQPAEDVLPHHPRDPDPDPALRHGPAARDRRGRRLVHHPRHREDAARPVRPDGPGQLLHGPQRRLPVPADRDLPALPGRADPRRRRRRPAAPRRGSPGCAWRARRAAWRARARSGGSAPRAAAPARSRRR